jgi:glycosyltransferase involved in cell wall biosynthesis
MKLLLSSNALWASSGYGVQAKSLMPRLADLPIIGGRQNVAQFAWYGLQGGIHNVQGFRIYPGGADPYGNDIIGAHTKDFGADVVVTLIDAWVLQDHARKIAPAKWLPWLPIDHDPVPDKVLQAIEGAFMPLTYSRWGHDLLAKHGVENTYIPHGVEVDTYKVYPADVVADFKRERLGNPGHLTLMVAANKGYPDRKAFQVQLRAWAAFAKDKPDAYIYLHTDPRTVNGGIDIMALAANLGITDRLMLPNAYQYTMGFAPHDLAMLYNSADVLLSASMSEGFGIPIIEAQACGTPAIVTGFSAMPELCFAGAIVPPADMIWTPLNSWQAWPDVKGIRDELEQLYAAGPRSAEECTELSAIVHGEYSWDRIVAEHWGPLLNAIADVPRPPECMLEPPQ